MTKYNAILQKINTNVTKNSYKSYKKILQKLQKNITKVGATNEQTNENKQSD